MSHAQTVRTIYAAFQRGDIPAILEQLAEDVEWDFAYPASYAIPWLLPRRGRAAVAGFFQAVADHLDFSRFEIEHLLAEGPVVVALASLDATVKPTGRPIRESEEAHIWHFDERGKVRRFRHAADTLQHHRALQR